MKRGSMGGIANLSQNDPGSVIDVATTEPVSGQRHTLPRKPLVEAYVALLLFAVSYFARPGDWIPGLSRVPLAKITGFLALLALVLSVWHRRQRVPREVLFLILLVGQLLLSAALSPVWRGGAFSVALNFAKVLM